MEAEIDCVTGIKGDPHCHPNPAYGFEGCTQKSQYDPLNTRYPAPVVLGSQKPLFGGTGGFCLDFTFHVCEVKDHLFGGTAGFYLEFPFSCIYDPLRFI
jgi:hypothetical protein